MGDILQPPGHPISYFPTLARVTGSIKAAILAQQISYWTPRAHDADGWIYKTQTEWMDETGFTLKEFRGACEELEARKLIVKEYDRPKHELRIKLQIDSYNLALQGIKDSLAHAKRAHAKRAHAKRAHAKRAGGIYQKGISHMPKGHMLTDSPIKESYESSRDYTETTTPPTPSEASTPDRFEEFWKAYPRKEAKGRARIVWKRLKPNAKLFEQILTAVIQQRASPQWTREQGKFIPHPATWLNDQRWEDEASPVSLGVASRYQPGDVLPDGSKKGVL